MPVRQTLQLGARWKLLMSFCQNHRLLCAKPLTVQAKHYWKTRDLFRVVLLAPAGLDRATGICHNKNNGVIEGSVAVSSNHCDEFFNTIS